MSATSLPASFARRHRQRRAPGPAGRPSARRSSRAYGVLAAYLHDIGMHDQTRVGRRLHPVYAAHVAFGSDLDDVVEELLGSDGPVVERLRAVQAARAVLCPLDVVLRELLSLTLAHSKSTVPAPLLDDRARLPAPRPAAPCSPTSTTIGRPRAA